ncbi:MAG: hypothetical protein KDA71_02855 [Planctomycetales bacterium]|nr:hypothetical protein [Planctomycetales bacterium]
MSIRGNDRRRGTPQINSIAARRLVASGVSEETSGDRPIGSGVFVQVIMILACG